MLLLGIESSCDETAVAVYCSKRGVLAHALHSQVATHRAFGGVVPELASRDHVRFLVPLLDEALTSAGVAKHELDAVAYTAGPGLVGALLVGASFAKSLAYALSIPALAMHHLEAHVLVTQLDSPELQFPFTVLLVSGGHTQLIAAHQLGHYTLLGETLDDAVGEVFDKLAKRMGMPYPGGPTLAALADEAEGMSDVMPFPRPMLNRPGCDFSFSGLKTHALLAFENSAHTLADARAVAKAFQDAVVDVLMNKCQRALAQTGHTQLVVAGGVSANRALRQALNDGMTRHGVKVCFPRHAYCTDNGVMVAYAGCLHAMQGARDETNAIQVKPRWPLILADDLNA